jgi:SAM-dependent methyltransferase
MIDQSFSSFDEWISWATLNPQIHDSNFVNERAKDILTNGVLEPITQRHFPPTQLTVTSNNWREDLVANGVNSRMRAVMYIIEQKLAHIQTPRIYGAEALTAFASRMSEAFDLYTGSEYLPDQESQKRFFPTIHQDLTSLTFPDACFDLVTTNEVLEHVPNIDASLRELARILVPGGWHVGTHPFRFMDRTSERRTELVDGVVVHHLPPEYHGNPTDPEKGALVFETPGWDILERAERAGFSKAQMRFIHCPVRGILTQNTGVFVFCAQR